MSDLSQKIGNFQYSPAREIFRSCYSELVRTNSLMEQAYTKEMAVSAALDNLNRALFRCRNEERKNLEKFLPFLAVTASASPFIGLLGTVWGVVGSFEGIIRVGDTSLLAVAPGISEAFVATAFGLGAAIPAVIGYNIIHARLRKLWISLDGFGADIMNIIERHLVTGGQKIRSNK